MERERVYEFAIRILLSAVVMVLGAFLVSCSSNSGEPESRQIAFDFTMPDYEETFADADQIPYPVIISCRNNVPMLLFLTIETPIQDSDGETISIRSNDRNWLLLSAETCDQTCTYCYAYRAYCPEEAGKVVFTPILKTSGDGFQEDVFSRLNVKISTYNVKWVEKDLHESIIPDEPGMVSEETLKSVYELTQE